MLEGINPQALGLPIVFNFFEHVRKKIIPNIHKDTNPYWKSIQKSISGNKKYRLYDSNIFFKWLEKHKFNSIENYGPNILQILKYKIFYFYPYIPEILRKRLQENVSPLLWSLRRELINILAA
jgi:hypothetical protein